MQLNTLKPALGSKKNRMRVGRGIGCTKGKTCRRGHKGQKSRSGGYHKVGFEGGQMPIQKRVPKFGFTSRKSLFSAAIPLSSLNSIKEGSVDIQCLKKHNIIRHDVKYVKVYLSGKLKNALKLLPSIKLTSGASAQVVAAGGEVIS